MGGDLERSFLWCGVIPFPYGNISLSHTVPVLPQLLAELPLSDLVRRHESSAAAEPSFSRDTVATSAGETRLLAAGGDSLCGKIPIP